MKKWIGPIQVLLAGIGFGFLGIFGRLAFQNQLSVGDLLFWRFLFASLILWTSLFFINKQLIFLKPRQILYSFALGIFGYAIFSTLYFESMKGLSIALAAMLLFTFPIFVSLGAHFILKEKMNSLQWCSLGIACLGLVLLLWGDLFFDSFKYFFLALSAAITYSFYVLISGKVQKNVEPLSSSLYVISSAAVGLYFIHQPDLSMIVNFSTQQHLIILGIAIFCSIAPMTLFLAGLQKMRSSQASLIVMIEPVVAAFAAWMILNEALSLRQTFGSALVLLALALNTQSNKTSVGN
jgi:drug/metabolite transporter (DMT)-like permease